MALPCINPAICKQGVMTIEGINEFPGRKRYQLFDQLIPRDYGSSRCWMQCILYAMHDALFHYPVGNARPSPLIVFLIPLQKWSRHSFVLPDSWIGGTIVREAEVTFARTPLRL